MLILCLAVESSGYSGTLGTLRVRHCHDCARNSDVPCSGTHLRSPEVVHASVARFECVARVELTLLLVCHRRIDQGQAE